MRTIIYQNFPGSFRCLTSAHYLKKPAWFILAFMLMLLKPAFAQYCTPTYSTYSVCAGGSINNVTFETINNSPGCASGSSAAYYKDFTSTLSPVTVLPGNSYPISMSIGNNWNGSCNVWIDFDQNQVFDPSEVVYTGSGGSSSPYIYTGTVTIPTTASAGITRMRVMGQEGGPPSDPCAGGYSEIHDYALSIGGSPDNAGISALTEPLPGTFCPGSSVDAKINVINAGNNVINGVMIEWELDGASQLPISWGNPIDTFGSLMGNSEIITLGNISFPTSATRTIKAWTSMPNGVVDTFNTNDTIWASLKPALSGTFTIGATGADYTSLAAAATDLNTAGICGPVLFNIQAGTFTGSMALNQAIGGSSATNTITFKGIDTASTIITSSGNSTIALIGASHVTFRDMKIMNTAGSTVIWLGTDNGKGADSNYFINCNISNPIGSSGYGILASGAETYTSLGNNANYTLIDSCTIIGGQYGVYFYGDDQEINVANTVRNSFISYNYSTAIATEYQSGFKVQKNIIAYAGNGINTFPSSVSLRNNSFEGSVVEKNIIYGAVGGYGIFSLWNTNTSPEIFANNIIIVGSGPNTSMGIRAGSNSADVVYNTVDIQSTDMNSTAFNLIPSSGSNYNILNNIFRNNNPGQIININTGGATIELDHNCYHGTGTFPYRVNNTNQTTLAAFISSANIFSDSFSIQIDPVFFSATDLRSNDAGLDKMGRPVSSVSTDIDDSLRSLTTPDIGVNEFTLPPRSDAGIIAIIAPNQPVTPGLSEVAVVIKNSGIGDLTYALVSYQSGSTLFSQDYTETLPQGKTDTVIFAAASGPGLDQRLNIPTTSFEIKAWTSNPNYVADTDSSNDSLTRSYCQPLNGAYTINPAGAGTTNFTSITAAINALACGGISAPVIFNIATGTYTEQVSIPYIAGTDTGNTITFSSATNNRNDVTINYSSTADSNNFVVALEGTKNVSFKNLTLTNSGAAYSRVFVYKSRAGKGNSYINVNHCNVSGATTTTSSNDLALFYGPDANDDIEITHCSISNGAYGIMLNGWPVVYQFSKNTRVDSNTFDNNYTTAVYLSNRENLSISGNNIVNSNANTGKNGISIGSTAGDVIINANKIEMNTGTGISAYNYSYYAEPGRALISNNSIVLNGTGNVSQIGIKLYGCSKTDAFNNSVKLSSSKSTVDVYSSFNFGLFVEGDISYANLGNSISNDVKIVNNIFYNEDGYPVYFAEKFFGTGGRVSANSISQIDHNLYYNNSGNNIAYVFGNLSPDYSKANFDAYKRAVLYMGDLNSIYAEPIFISANDLKPEASSPAAWYANGRGIQLTSVSKDFTGAARSISVQTGPPDIGAFEFSPASLPPLAIAVPAVAVAGQTQAFLFLGDTVAKITWDPFFDVPASIEVSQYVGEKPPHIGTAAEYTYTYTSIKLPTPSSSYNYSVDLFYKDFWTGTIAAETDLRMIQYLPTTGWDAFSGLLPLSTVDDVNNVISGLGLVDSSILLTGASRISPLPVKLLRISAAKAFNDVVINWATATELNSNYFEIQRSTGNGDWKTVGKVKSAGNSNHPLAYQLTDKGAFLNGTATLYYRLKMVDLNAGYEYSRVMAVNSDKTSNTTADIAYPNPFNNELFINIQSEQSSTVLIELHDITGKKIKSQSYNNMIGSSEINLELDKSMNSGIYFLSIEKNGARSVQKLVKQ
jgi:hypothetical protein